MEWLVLIFSLPLANETATLGMPSSLFAFSTFPAVWSGIVYLNQGVRRLPVREGGKCAPWEDMLRGLADTLVLEMIGRFSPSFVA